MEKDLMLKELIESEKQLGLIELDLVDGFLACSNKEQMDILYRLSMKTRAIFEKIDGVVKELIEEEEEE